MNTLNPMAPAPTLQEIVDTAIAHCASFTELLKEENEALSTKNTSILEELTKQKRHLAAKLEVAMGNIQRNKNLLMQSTTVSISMQKLQVYIDVYKEQARKNMVLLKASHEATTQFIDMVRRAVSAQKPQAKTYGNNGQMTDNTSNTSIFNKSI
jgi:flagellar biosynthesis/type III secretory pathway chaperone